MTELAEKETDRAWTRYNVMLTITGGVFALLTFAWNTGKPLVVMAPALLGLVISFVWLQINKWSYYYEHRWHADMEAIIDSDKYLTEWVRARMNPRIKRPAGKTGWRAFNWLPRILIALWAVVITLCLLSFQYAVLQQLFPKLTP